MPASSGFKVLIYSNPVRSNKLVADWSAYVEGLNFGTNAFGGYGASTFVLKRPESEIQEILYGWTSQPYLTNRIRLIDPYGKCVYEGMLYDLTAHFGNEPVSRSAAGLFNCVRMDYQVPESQSVNMRQYYATHAGSRNRFGKKVKRLEMPGTYALSSTTPSSTALRYLNQRHTPSKSDSKRKGGSGGEVTMDVSCVGLITPALEWRYAFGTLATLVDTSQVIKDMLGANPVAEGLSGAWVGPAGSGWSERLDSSNLLGYGQQFISTNVNKIQASGTNIERKTGTGGTRLDIVKQAASYGSVNNKRMLFRVFDDERLNAGKGIAQFNEMNETLPFMDGYTGYYDLANEPIVLNGGRTRIPLWKVRAGNWITTIGIAPKNNYPTIYDHPAAFWIEETNYSVDDNVLTMSSTDEFNLEQYLGRLINGKKVIAGVL